MGRGCGDCGIPDNLGMSAWPPAPDPATHWLVPCAALDDPAALEGLTLPNLRALLGHLAPQAQLGGDTERLNPPHERALAWAIGLPDADGQLPWAALGSEHPERAQAWVHPVHFQVGMDQVRLFAGEALDLDEATSRSLCAALAPLCAEDGVRLTVDSATRWRAEGPRLAGLALASLDRVSGRGVAAWQPRGPEGAWLRRLGNEAQMLFYTHPAHDARQAAGRLPVNGVWVSAPGAVIHGLALRRPPTVLDALRAPALAADTTAWRHAWTALDAGPLADLLGRAARGEPVHLTLCGERHAVCHGPRDGGWWTRLRARWSGAPDPIDHLRTL